MTDSNIVNYQIEKFLVNCTRELLNYNFKRHLNGDLFYQPNSYSKIEEVQLIMHIDIGPKVPILEFAKSMSKSLTEDLRDRVDYNTVTHLYPDLRIKVTPIFKNMFYINLTTTSII